MLKIILFTQVFMLLYCCVNAQKQGNVWYFGRHAGIDFNKTPAQVLTDGQVNTRAGSSSVCDSNGLLLFYTDGVTVFNKLHQAMANGANLCVTNSATQSATIVPWPGMPHLYYIFTTDHNSNSGAYGYRYAIVDMSKNNGLGEVTIKQQLLYRPCTEKLTVARHCNGRDWWVITKMWGNNQFQCYLVDNNGIHLSPVLSSAGSPLTGSFAKSRGYMKISADNKKLAVLYDGHTGDAWLELFEFDNSTGRVSNAVRLNEPLINSSMYGLEFSPDCRLLYIGDIQNLRVQQFDLSQWNATAIAASVKTISPAGYNKEPCALQSSPDKKIYIMTVDLNFKSEYLDVIHSPDQSGNACGFQANAVYLNSGIPNSIGLPNIFPGMMISPATPPAGNLPVRIRSRITDACNRLVEFTAEVDQATDITYKWYSGDGDSSTAGTFEKKYSTAVNRYNVKLKVTGRLPYCGGIFTGSGEASSVIEFEPLPNAFAGRDTVIAAGQSLQLNASGGKTYEWNPRALVSNAFIPNPVTIPANDQLFTVVARNNAGCESKDTIFVKVYKKPGIYTPNAFTPNGDRHNELFRVTIPGVTLHYVRVYNRWGSLVYNSNDPSKGWDGTYKDKPQPAGAYVWMAAGVTYNGEKIQEKGTLLLIR